MCVHVQHPYVVVHSLLKAISIVLNDASISNFYVPFSRKHSIVYIPFLLFLLNEMKEGTFQIEREFFWLFCLFSADTFTIHTKPNKYKCLICTSQSVSKDSSRPVSPSLSVFLRYLLSKEIKAETSRYICLFMHHVQTNEKSILWLFYGFCASFL